MTPDEAKKVYAPTMHSGREFPMAAARFFADALGTKAALSPLALYFARALKNWATYRRLQFMIVESSSEALYGAAGSDKTELAEARDLLTLFDACEEFDLNLGGNGISLASATSERIRNKRTVWRIEMYAHLVEMTIASSGDPLIDFEDYRDQVLTA